MLCCVGPLNGVSFTLSKRLYGASNIGNAIELLKP
jgi:hypothetical protein